VIVGLTPTCGTLGEIMLDHKIFDTTPAIKALLGKIRGDELFRACILELAKLCEKQQLRIEELEKRISNDTIRLAVPLEKEGKNLSY
jgi:hypothetical protein